MEQSRPDFLFQDNERFFLDPNTPIPLYHQMEQVIQQRIMHPDAVGKMLPSEKDLMTIFDVSRATIRKTLDNLVEQGLVERRRALGTKVIRQELTEKLSQLTGYTEEMKQKGLSVRSTVLDVATHVPDDHVREKLQIAQGQQTLRIWRLRGTNEVFPVVLLRSDLSPDLPVDVNEDFNGSLYKLLENKCGVRIEWAEEEIRARGATEEEARHLEITPHDCVLVMNRVTYTIRDKPIEHVVAVYRSDRFKYSIRLHR